MDYCCICGSKMIDGVCPTCGFSYNQGEILDEGHIECEKETASGERLFEEGMKYYEGNGVNQDYTEALKYFFRAGEEKYVPAYTQLGKMFENGEGVFDRKRAKKYFKMAAENGDPEGCHLYALTFLEGKPFKSRVPEYEVWETKAADGGYGPACLKFALYFQGKDVQEAKKWYLKQADLLTPLAEGGDPKAQRELGRLYAFGWGVEQNLEKAMSLYKEAEKKEYELTQSWIANLYLYGIGVEENFEEAVRRMLITAEAGGTSLYYRLYDLYRKRNEYEAAFRYAKLAAENGDTVAFSDLAWMYREGLGVKKDPEKAEFWANLARYKQD